MDDLTLIYFKIPLNVELGNKFLTFFFNHKGNGNLQMEATPSNAGIEG